MALLNILHCPDPRLRTVAKPVVDFDEELRQLVSDMFERLRLSKEDHDFLFSYAKKINMPFISTAFDEKSVDILMDYNIDAFKIASFDNVRRTFKAFVYQKNVN